MLGSDYRIVRPGKILLYLRVIGVASLIDSCRVFFYEPCRFASVWISGTEVCD